MADFCFLDALYKGVHHLYQHLGIRQRAKMSLIGPVEPKPKVYAAFICGIVTNEADLVENEDYRVPITLVNTNGETRVHPYVHDHWIVSCTRLYVSSLTSASPDRFLSVELTVSERIPNLLSWLHRRLTALTIDYLVSWPVSLKAVLEKIELSRFKGPLCIAPLQFLDGEDFALPLLSNLNRNSKNIDVVVVTLFFLLDDLSALEKVIGTAMPLLLDGRMEVKFYFAFSSYVSHYEMQDFMQHLPDEFAVFIKDWIYTTIYCLNGNSLETLIVQCLQRPRANFVGISEPTAKLLPCALEEFRIFTNRETCAAYNDNARLAVVPVSGPIRIDRLSVTEPTKHVFPWLHPGLTGLSIYGINNEKFDIKFEDVLSRIRLFKFKHPLMLDILHFPDGENFARLILNHLNQYPKPQHKIRIHLKVAVDSVQRVREVMKMTKPLVRDRRIKGKLTIIYDNFNDENPDAQNIVFESALAEFPRLQKEYASFLFTF